MINNRILSVFLCLAVALTGIQGCSKNNDDNQPAQQRVIGLKLVHPTILTNYMGKLSREFAKKSPTLSDGRKIELELIAKPSLEASRLIANGKIKPHGWLSSSTSLTRYTNISISNLGSEQGDCIQLFGTPIVLAVPLGYKEAIVREGVDYNWDQLFESAIANQEEQRQYLTVSHSSPLSSASGLAALIQLSYLAAYKQQEVLDLDTLTTGHTLKTLTRYEGKISEYAADDSYLIQRALDANAKRLRLLLTTEQSVVQHNLTAPANKKLASLYSNDGTYWMDYNLCTSKSDWVTPAHRAAMQQLSEFISGKSAQYAVRGEGFRPSIVKFESGPPMDQEHGVTLTKPSKSALPVHGAVVQYLMKNWSKLKRPLALQVVLDLSGSMEGSNIHSSKEQLRKLFALASKTRLIGLTTFATEASNLVALSDAPKELLSALSSARALGGSAIYDAIRIAFSDYKPEHEKYRKIVLVVTDGDDKNSETGLSRLKQIVEQKAAQQDIRLIVIGIKDSKANFTDMKELAARANGTFIESTGYELEKAFEEVHNSL